MNRTVLWLMLVIVLVGGYGAYVGFFPSTPPPRLPDAELQVFYEPEKFARIRIQTGDEMYDQGKVWYEVPDDLIPEFLKVLQPTDRIYEQTKCSVIGNISLDDLEGTNYFLFLHGGDPGYHAHGSTNTGKKFEFAAPNWKRITELLETTKAQGKKVSQEVQSKHT